MFIVVTTKMLNIFCSTVSPWCYHTNRVVVAQCIKAQSLRRTIVSGSECPSEDLNIWHTIRCAPYHLHSSLTHALPPVIMIDSTKK